MPEISRREAEHWSRVEAAQAEVTRQLYELAAKFGQDSPEELLVRQAETEDWDLTKRKTLLSELTAKLERRRGQSSK